MGRSAASVPSHLRVHEPTGITCPVSVQYCTAVCSRTGVLNPVKKIVYADDYPGRAAPLGLVCRYGAISRRISKCAVGIEALDHLDQLGQRLCLHLVHRPLAMSFYSVFGNSKLSRNLFILQA
jgi:hypothetical protein